MIGVRMADMNSAMILSTVAAKVANLTRFVLPLPEQSFLQSAAISGVWFNSMTE